MPTEDAYSSGHLVLSHMGFANVLLLRLQTLDYTLQLVHDNLPRLDFLPTLTLLLNIGFHRASATGVACRQGTLTPPDTWSCPTLGLASVLMLRPISPELVLFLDFWVSNIPRYFCFCLDIWNRRGPPETEAAEWLAWQKLESTLMMLLFIFIFLKQLITE